jgi:hypothetical protein
VSALLLPILIAYVSAPARAQTISADSFELRGPNGRRAALIAMAPNGSPGIWLMDPQGRPRLELGLYPENDFTPGVVLNDEQGRAAGLFRMAGPNHSPVLVFKADGQDRMVQGLDMNEPSRAPFLTLAGQPGNRFSAPASAPVAGAGGRGDLLLTALIALAAGALGGRLSSRS